MDWLILYQISGKSKEKFSTGMPVEAGLINAGFPNP
jgi:hypothetical protein